MSTTLAKDDYHLNDTQKQIRLASIACSQFSVDDWLLLLGLTGYAVMTVFLVLSINDGGFGRKTGELPVSVLHTGLKVQYSLS
ncbi:hypothetical protein MPH_13543 [Macrophomina phaseolina MS6]|uniref:Uncharacterized protein n=1 Tax=Macrophomina phaseolina (strain MS6) TaxID=1126212 RepID=K2RY99_MACPH|nr:hypothetical protein MPH_13543 [Macrophomina phaseolina MS6]